MMKLSIRAMTDSTIIAHRPNSARRMLLTISPVVPAVRGQKGIHWFIAFNRASRSAAPPPDHRENADQHGGPGKIGRRERREDRHRVAPGRKPGGVAQQQDAVEQFMPFAARRCGESDL